MTEKFKDKYRISSTRLQNWNYGWNASYFITICTQHREHLFGKIEDGKMILSNVGVIADLCWFEIKNHAKNIALGEYIVMPNHIHGILILYGNEKDDVNSVDDSSVDDVDAIDGKIDVNDVGVVETRHALSLQHQQWQRQQHQHQQNAQHRQALITQKQTIGHPIGHQRFQNQGKNTISSIVGGYKSAVSKHANRLNFDFGWHPRFHDHIIKDVEAFENISNYIINNPLTWKEDKFY